MTVSILLAIIIVLAVRMRKLCKLDANKNEEIAYLQLTVQHLRGKQNYGDSTKNSSKAPARGTGIET
ncbi:hypothetical protein [Emergencia timonensis]|uniref:hypothetical protein n=1 Tax=Emergencia timonensis TaxID=1776384 RepID=UPI00266BC914|nr:hypothetical protein [Emergencia timonensis]